MTDPNFTPGTFAGVVCRNVQGIPRMLCRDCVVGLPQPDGTRRVYIDSGKAVITADVPEADLQASGSFTGDRRLGVIPKGTPFTVGSWIDIGKEEDHEHAWESATILNRIRGEYVAKLDSTGEVFLIGYERIEIEAEVRAEFCLWEKVDWRPKVDPKVRNRVLRSAQNKCKDCGKSCLPQNLELHHRSYARWGYETPDDFDPLCRRCHRQRHEVFEGGRSYDPEQAAAELSLISDEIDEKLARDNWAERSEQNNV